MNNMANNKNREINSKIRQTMSRYRMDLKYTNRLKIDFSSKRR